MIDFLRYTQYSQYVNSNLLFVVARIFGVGHRVDRCVVKVINLLARFGLHEPVECQKPRHGRLGHHKHV